MGFRPFILILLTLTTSAAWGWGDGPITPAAPAAPKGQLVTKMGWDMELIGNPLAIWLDQVVDLDHIERLSQWRSGTPLAIQLQALSELPIENPEVIALLPKHLQEELLKDLPEINTQKLQEAIQSDHSILLGADGKPLAEPPPTLKVPRNTERPRSASPGIVQSGGLVDAKGNPLKHESVGDLLSPGQRVEYQKQVLRDQELSRARNRYQLLHERFEKMISDPKVAREIFGEIPFKNFGLNSKTLIALYGGQKNEMLTTVKPGQDFLKDVDVTLDGTLELKLETPYTDPKKYLDHLRKLSSRLGAEALVFHPTNSTGKNGNIHFHLSFDPELLTEAEYDELFKRYKFKNAVEVGLDTYPGFKSRGLLEDWKIFEDVRNGYRMEFTSRGNVRKKEPFHFEFREATKGPDALLAEFQSYLGDLAKYPPKERLAIAAKRVDEALVQAVKERPLLFKEVFDAKLAEICGDAEFSYLTPVMLDPKLRGSAYDVGAHVAQKIRSSWGSSESLLFRLRAGTFRFEDLNRLTQLPEFHEYHDFSKKLLSEGYRTALVAPDKRPAKQSYLLIQVEALLSEGNPYFAASKDQAAVIRLGNGATLLDNQKEALDHLFHDWSGPPAHAEAALRNYLRTGEKNWAQALTEYLEKRGGTEILKRPGFKRLQRTLSNALVGFAFQERNGRKYSISNAEIDRLRRLLPYVDSKSAPQLKRAIAETLSLGNYFYNNFSDPKNLEILRSMFEYAPPNIHLELAGRLFEKIPFDPPASGAFVDVLREKSAPRFKDLTGRLLKGTLSEAEFLKEAKLFYVDPNLGQLAPAESRRAALAKLSDAGKKTAADWMSKTWDSAFSIGQWDSKNYFETLNRVVDETILADPSRALEASKGALQHQSDVLMLHRWYDADLSGVESAYFKALDDVSERFVSGKIPETKFVEALEPGFKYRLGGAPSRARLAPALKKLSPEMQTRLATQFEKLVNSRDRGAIEAFQDLLLITPADQRLATLQRLKAYDQAVTQLTKKVEDKLYESALRAFRDGKMPEETFLKTIGDCLSRTCGPRTPARLALRKAALDRLSPAGRSVLVSGLNVQISWGGPFAHDVLEDLAGEYFRYSPSELKMKTAVRLLDEWSIRSRWAKLLDEQELKKQVLDAWPETIEAFVDGKISEAAFIENAEAAFRQGLHPQTEEFSRQLARALPKLSEQNLQKLKLVKINADLKIACPTGGKFQSFLSTLFKSRKTPR